LHENLILILGGNKNFQNDIIPLFSTPSPYLPTSLFAYVFALILKPLKSKKSGYHTCHTHPSYLPPTMHEIDSLSSFIIFSVPGHCLSAEDGAINQTEKDSCLH
jgi:hypothetical protein